MVIRKIIRGGTLQDFGIMIREIGKVLERKAKDEDAYDTEEECKYPRLIIGQPIDPVDYGEIGRKAWVPPGYSLPLIIEDTVVATFKVNGKEGVGEIRAYKAPYKKISFTVNWSDDYSHLQIYGI